MSEKVRLSVRVDAEQWKKFKYIASKQNLRPYELLISALQQDIQLFEKKHGSIDAAT